MKKRILFILLIIVLILLIILLVKGCNRTSKLVCTNYQEIGNAKLDTKTIIEFKNNYRVKTKTVFVAEFDDNESASIFKDNYKNKKNTKDENISVKEDNNTITITSTKSINKKDIKKDSNKKDYIKTELEKNNFLCK